MENKLFYICTAKCFKHSTPSLTQHMQLQMKKEFIDALFLKFEEACYLIEGTECWSARELQTILGYAEWRNFLHAIEKAKTACTGAGEELKHHFVDVN